MRYSVKKNITFCLLIGVITYILIPVTSYSQTAEPFMKSRNKIRIIKLLPADKEQQILKEFKISKEYLQYLRKTKRNIASDAFKSVYFSRRGTSYIKLKDREMPLISKAIMDVAPPDEKLEEAKHLPGKLEKFRGYIFEKDLIPGLIPQAVDHRSKQTPIKNQGERGTCVAFASLAAMEALTLIPNDLSEQYAYHLFMVKEGKRCWQNEGLETWKGAEYLKDGVCIESLWPYESSDILLAKSDSGQHRPPAEAVSNANCKVITYQLIFDEGSTSIRNTHYLESILRQGYDIVYGTGVA